MGCDIHFFVEKKDESGVWRRQDDREEKPSLDCDIKEYMDWRDREPDYIYSGRNYDLFGILANVRNGRGFAGIVTGEGFNPISEPRGLPDDVSPEIKAESDQYGGDGHSHSYFTVAELDEYDWNQVTTDYGVVSVKGFKEYLEKGYPTQYCGAIFGNNIEMVSNARMKELIESGEAYESDVPNYHTRVGWEVPYWEAAGRFYTDTLPALRELGNPEDVRIVFWFDN